ncbi:AbrB/MazE/SpoVT family DNA-binding domain-containing protein [Chloroflexota bacterium]
MATAEIKRVLKLGGSLAIVLPNSWVKGRIKAGEEMIVVGNGELRIFPVYSKGSTAKDDKR